jgi:hypothetical protein
MRFAIAVAQVKTALTATKNYREIISELSKARAFLEDWSPQPPN